MARETAQQYADKLRRLRATGNASAVDKFRKLPTDVNTDNHTVVTCSHPYHGIEQFFLSPEDYEANLIPLTRSMWANGYTILIQPL